MWLSSEESGWYPSFTTAIPDHDNNNEAHNRNIKDVPAIELVTLNKIKMRRNNKTSKHFNNTNKSNIKSKIQ